MKNTTVRLVVILGIFAIAGIVVVQTYWMLRAWDLKEKQLDQSIQIALQNTAQKLAARKKVTLPDNTVKQVSSDYYFVNINDEIDANWLEYYLRTEFMQLQIGLDFEYAIYDCNTDKMMYGNYIKAESNTEKIKRTKNLPKYSKFTYYFAVHLPTRTTYLVTSLQLWIVFSGILLVVVVFLGYAMVVILQQKRLSELQKDFINNMTHEFKTPIATIQIAANVLEQNPQIQQDSRLWQYTKIIAEQNARLNSQTEKVLQVARMDKHGIKLQKERFDMHTVIQQVSESMNIRAGSESPIQLHLHTNKPIILADKHHFTNILYNLIDNSLKYCNTIPRIHISTQNHKKGVLLQIEDNGIGIEKKYWKQVFSKFFRVPTGNIHNVKGFGLGLYYVAEVCRAHHWKIKLDSNPPQEGSIFKVFLD